MRKNERVRERTKERVVLYAYACERGVGIGMQPSLIPVSCKFVARLGRDGRNRVGNDSIQPRILIMVDSVKTEKKSLQA